MPRARVSEAQAHGTTTGYSSYKCRTNCPASPTCSEAMSAYQKAYNAKKKGGEVATPVLVRTKRTLAATLPVSEPEYRPIVRVPLARPTPFHGQPWKRFDTY